MTPDLGLEILPVAKVLDAILEAIPGQPSQPSELADSYADEEEEEDDVFGEEDDEPVF
ncbi:MAG: hypothetical protein KME19_23430 [Microcoleus vaginatus WJT46-NPBG5]|jgi:hypothetical protein|nr:hypothetical protein [Microcoleus vaginatus WJT46-NPBG5]